MNDLECLRAYRVKALEAEMLRRAMENLEERLGPQGLRTAQSAGPHTNEPRHAALQHLDAYSEQYEANRRSMEALRPQLERIVQRAANSRDRAILMDFYGHGAKNEVIACTTGLSARHVARIRHQFTEKLEKEDA